MLRRPRGSTLFPYTTLFRSVSTEISGEIDVRCDPWDPQTWTSAPWNGDAWTGAQWSGVAWTGVRSEEHTSELQSHVNLVCRLLLEKKKKNIYRLDPYHVTIG